MVRYLVENNWSDYTSVFRWYDVRTYRPMGGCIDNYDHVTVTKCVGKFIFPRIALEKK